MASKMRLASVLLLLIHAATCSRLRETNIAPVSAEYKTLDGYHPQQLAGYFQLNRTYAAEMFYFFFENRHSATAPLILWMTGIADLGVRAV